MSSKELSKIKKQIKNGEDKNIILQYVTDKVLIRYLVQIGADNRLALIKMIEYRYLEDAQALIDQGVDIGVVDEKHLQRACSKGELAVVKFFIKNRAVISRKTFAIAGYYASLEDGAIEFPATKALYIEIFQLLFNALHNLL